MVISIDCQNFNKGQLHMDCVFCGIIDGTLPSKKCFENDMVLGFHDIHPVAPVHVLLIPKKHIPTMNDVTSDDLIYISEIHRVAQVVAKELGISESGYQLVNSCNENGGQVIYHLHYHLIGGEKLRPLNG